MKVTTVDIGDFNVSFLYPGDHLRDSGKNDEILGRGTGTSKNTRKEYGRIEWSSWLFGMDRGHIYLNYCFQTLI